MFLPTIPVTQDTSRHLTETLHCSSKNAPSSQHNVSILVALGKMHVEFKTQAPLSNCSDPTTWAGPAELLQEASMQAMSCFACTVASFNTSAGQAHVFGSLQWVPQQHNEGQSRAVGNLQTRFKRHSAGLASDQPDILALPL